jgi:CRP/FNR family transcriptional regulator, cyclic AMP receptor protein
MSSSPGPAFDPGEFLSKAGLGRRIVELEAKQTIFAQGDAADSVFYIQEGSVKLSVISARAKEAVLALLSPGEFLGEDSIPAPHSLRVVTATAVTPSKVLKIGRTEMVRVIHEERAFSDLFVKFLLSRTKRIQEDLVDQLFNSSEKRLARTLLLLARYGEANPQRKLPKISQETLAEMIGATRSRVNFFMNKFRKLGLIEYNGGLKINASLLSIVLHD